MRNQTWQSDGILVEDWELYREGNVAKVKDWLTGIVRDASTEEDTRLEVEERGANRQEAMERAKGAIKVNATSPWGRVLYDLAIAQGWIESE